MPRSCWKPRFCPTGWTWPEGRFGEFTQLMGGLHWNPLVKVNAITMKANPIYYSLHMPWEGRLARRAAALRRVARLSEGGEHRGARHQRDPRWLRLLARHHLDQEAAGGGQERNTGRGVGDGHQTCHHQSIRISMYSIRPTGLGDRDPRAGRQGCGDPVERTRQAARPEPRGHEAGRGADHSQDGHRRDAAGGNSARALRPHPNTLM